MLLVIEKTLHATCYLLLANHALILAIQAKGTLVLFLVTKRAFAHRPFRGSIFGHSTVITNLSICTFILTFGAGTYLYSCQLATLVTQSIFHSLISTARTNTVGCSFDKQKTNGNIIVRGGGSHGFEVQLFRIC